MQVTIEKLRKSKFKVRVMHTRHYETISRGMSGPYNTLSCKGGSTKVEVTTPDKTVTVIGQAQCTLEESFNRKLGNRIALGRAMKKLSEFPHLKEVLEAL